MSDTTLLDTSFPVALINRGGVHHRKAVEVIDTPSLVAYN